MTDNKIYPVPTENILVCKSIAGLLNPHNRDEWYRCQATDDKDIAGLSCACLVLTPPTLPDLSEVKTSEYLSQKNIDLSKIYTSGGFIWSISYQSFDLNLNDFRFITLISFGLLRISYLNKYTCKILSVLIWVEAISYQHIPWRWYIELSSFKSLFVYATVKLCIKSSCSLLKLQHCQTFTWRNCVFVLWFSKGKYVQIELKM